MASYKMNVKIGGNGKVVQKPVVQSGRKRNGCFLSGCLVGDGGGVRVKRRRSPYTFYLSIFSRPNNYCMRFHWTLDSRTDVSIS